MRIVDVFELESGKVAVIQGNDLAPGMVIESISTPYGEISVLAADPVKEACFSPGCLQGALLIDRAVHIEPCDAIILKKH